MLALPRPAAYPSDVAAAPSTAQNAAAPSFELWARPASPRPAGHFTPHPELSAAVVLEGVVPQVRAAAASPDAPAK
jgi:hypothetical protein